jgi:hypothetical protein
MSATLRQHDPNSTPAAPEGYVVEHIECADGSCTTRYVLAYPPDAATTEDGTTVLDTMRAKAAELVASTHSLHDFRNYVWSGLQNGWVIVEKDLTAAGL